MLLQTDGPSQARTPIALRIAAFVAIAIALVAGVFVLGRLAADDSTAMALTTVWFVLVAAVAFGLVLRRRDLLLPFTVGFALVGIAAAIFLGRPILFDDVVNERVAVGTPASEIRGSPARNVELAQGTFEDVRHGGTGRAAIVELAGGGRVLTLTDFATSNGPDLFVYLVADRPRDEGGVDDFVNLGGLKGNRGNQQYAVPDGTDIGRYSTVVVWCRAFSALFTRAELLPS